VTTLDPEGVGLGEADGFQLRVNGALPGETVTVRVVRRKRRRLEAVAETVAGAHADRIAADCPVAGRCGGCSLQHVDPGAQRTLKRERLAALFAEAGVAPEAWLPDLTGPTRGYRHKARLGVRHVPGKGVLVGFRERGSARVTDTDACRVLAPVIGERLGALRNLIASLEAAATIPQLEVAVGDDAAALVVRHLEALSAADAAALTDFGARTGIQIWLQPGGLQTTHRLWPESGPERLHYRPSEDGPVLAFHPQDFTQVNPAINRAMVARVVDLLAPSPDDAVLDLFCGLGNFTLPLAARAGRVHGIEGSEALVERARENAAAGEFGNATFATADLYDEGFDPGGLPHSDLLLLDPPRSGAERICAGIGHLSPRRIVYVSCGPSSLARDAALLVAAGYRITAAGILDMFPHTAHVESMAVFDATDAQGRGAAW
jgi:23S rRNA (uracil1939-C5)-methyltransferase